MTNSTLPPLLVALVNHATEQTSAAMITDALTVAASAIEQADTTAERVRCNFIHGEDLDALDEQDTARVYTADRAYLLGFVTCWLLLTSINGGAR